MGSKQQLVAVEMFDGVSWPAWRAASSTRLSAFSREEEPRLLLLPLSCFPIACANNMNCAGAPIETLEQRSPGSLTCVV